MEKSLRECCRSIRIGKMLIRRQDNEQAEQPPKVLLGVIVNNVNIIMLIIQLKSAAFSGSLFLILIGEMIQKAHVLTMLEIKAFLNKCLFSNF